MIVDVRLRGDFGRLAGKRSLRRAAVAVVLRSKTGGPATVVAAAGTIRKPITLAGRASASGRALTASDLSAAVIRAPRKLSFFVGGYDAADLARVEVKTFASLMPPRRARQASISFPDGRVVSISGDQGTTAELELAFNFVIGTGPIFTVKRCDDLAFLSASARRRLEVVNGLIHGSARGQAAYGGLQALGRASSALAEVVARFHNIFLANCPPMVNTISRPPPPTGSGRLTIFALDQATFGYSIQFDPTAGGFKIEVPADGATPRQVTGGTCPGGGSVTVTGTDRARDTAVCPDTVPSATPATGTIRTDPPPRASMGARLFGWQAEMQSGPFTLTGPPFFGQGRYIGSDPYNVQIYFNDDATAFRMVGPYGTQFGSPMFAGFTCTTTTTRTSMDTISCTGSIQANATVSGGFGASPALPPGTRLGLSAVPQGGSFAVNGM
ncbi:MAG: hypothetical protein NVSMB25_09830 [Thermoleophilaceae bacterium]